MVDADHIGHPLDAFRHPLQVPECSGTWPDADYAACIGDGASVVSVYQPASAAGMRGQRGMRQNQWFRRYRRRPLDEIEGAVRDIDHDPKVIASPDHLRA